MLRTSKLLSSFINNNIAILKPFELFLKHTAADLTLSKNANKIEIKIQQNTHDTLDNIVLELSQVAHNWAAHIVLSDS